VEYIGSSADPHICRRLQIPNNLAAGPHGTSPRVPSPLQIPSRTTPTPTGPGSQPLPPQQDSSSSLPYAATDPPPHAPADAVPPLEDIPPARQMSPGAASDRSNFTSVSQRGINPRWRPDMPPVPGGGGGGGPQGYRGGGPPVPLPQSSRRPHVQQKQARQDMLLMDNPDFALGPASRSQRGPGGAGGAFPRAGAF
jgi:hypothetical protein